MTYGPLSKPQLIRQFKRWGFRKNIAGEEWKLIGIKIQQRKREGKESEVVFNGKIINPKTLRKELRRHAPAIGDPLDSGIESSTH